MTLGENIKKYRTCAKLTQKELAQEIGLGQSMLSQIEQNRADTTVTNLLKIAKALNCKMFNLVEGIDEEETECKTA